MQRREFLLQSAGGLGALWRQDAVERLGARHALGERRTATAAYGAQNAIEAAEAARDEQFWATVRRAYDLNQDALNLDHGWCNPAPRAAVDELVREAGVLEALPAEQLERNFFQMKNGSLRPDLAETLGVDPAEVAIVRNATRKHSTQCCSASHCRPVTRSCARRTTISPCSTRWNSGGHGTAC